MINDINSNKNQLNPFEIKAEILSVIEKLNDVKDFESYEIHFRTLDAQIDKKIIVKLLFKELSNLKNQNANIIKFLLKRYAETQELIDQLWVIIKSNMTGGQIKIVALDLLRELDTSWSYEDCNEYLDSDIDLVDADTKRLLNSAIINPEVQIDFLDFLNSLGIEDKITLIRSLGDDYTQDELANILIPVFLSQPDSEVGKTALSLLGESKSQLAFHALNTSLDFVNENLIPLVKKNLSILKMAGIREDNSLEFYKKLLKDSKPYRFCVTYPDGHGNQALIFSRLNESDKVQFVAIVIDDYHGIKDCFGFNEISKFECNTIIDRFYKGEKSLEITPKALKKILINAEKISKKSNNWFLPYEYVCWKNLLTDIEPETVDIKEILDSQLKKHKFTSEDFENVVYSDFMGHWFLNANYSSEFEEFIAELNSRLSQDKIVDMDKFINENIDKIFYDEEKTVWFERLPAVSYLKMLANEKELAQTIYNLYSDDYYKYELLKNIIRKSIYEYYFSLYSSEDKKIFDEARLDEIIALIEEKWVSNV